MKLHQGNPLKPLKISADGWEEVFICWPERTKDRELIWLERAERRVAVSGYDEVLFEYRRLHRD